MTSRTRAVWCAVVVALGARPAAAQVVVNPTLEVTPERDSATVGDSIALRVRVRLDDRDLLLDSVPRIVGGTPPGLRVLAAERVVRQPDRTFAGKIAVAFYRTGRREVPPFALTYRRNVTMLGAGIRSEPAVVEVVPVLPPGSGQPLKDIKGLAPAPGNGLLLLGSAMVLAVLSGVAAVVWRRRRRPLLAAPPASDEPTTAPGALEAALERLRGIEREAWPSRGEVARHYEAVVTVLRDYLAATTRVPARERTTAELLAALPASHTPNGTRERVASVLRDADLVKFARARPAPADAALFLEGTRELLTTWGNGEVR